MGSSLDLRAYCAPLGAGAPALPWSLTRLEAAPNASWRSRLRWNTVPTLQGPMTLVGFDDVLCRLRFGESAGGSLTDEQRDTELPGPTAGHWQQLGLAGTDFQWLVWSTLALIPRGQLLTYGQLAEHIGRPGSARAVGSAVGKNPLAWVLPCHRVVAGGGRLGGYTGGIEHKRRLLAEELSRPDLAAGED